VGCHGNSLGFTSWAFVLGRTGLGLTGGGTFLRSVSDLLEERRVTDMRKSVEDRRVNHIVVTLLMQLNGIIINRISTLEKFQLSKVINVYCVSQSLAKSNFILTTVILLFIFLHTLIA